MPFRSPKMYSFIFGFQRFVWWPKCTPASRRSFIAIAAKLPPCSETADRRCQTADQSEFHNLNSALSSWLTLAELEALARSGHAVFLTLLGARVAREEPFILQPLAQLEVVLDQRARNAQPHRARLPGHAAAGHCRQNVELVGGFGEDQRGSNLGAERFSREERFEGPLVDADGPGSGPKEHARGRCLAATGSVVLHCCHVTRPRALRVFAPRAGDPDRRRLSVCGTSPRPSSSWAACRARHPRPVFPACAVARGARVPRAIRPRSRCAADKSSDLPCDRSASPSPHSPRPRGRPCR